MNTRLNESDVVPRDFAIRDRNPSPQQIIGIFICVFAIASGVTMTTTNKAMIVPLLFILFAALCWYIVNQIQFIQDQLLDAEFQNALFSSSLGINNRFLAIVRNDNIIVYFNSGFQDTFPKFLRQPRRTIDLLLEQCEVKAGERDKIFGAITSGGNDKIIFDMYNESGPHKIIMSIEPILKPSGFVLLRGRDFVEIRKQVQTAPAPG